MANAKTLVVFVLVLFLAGISHAAAPVSGEIQAYLVTVDKNGEEKVTKTDQVEPGQVMEFELVFTNNGETSVSGIQVVDPIPENTLFIGESHNSDVQANFEVSIDGGQSFEAEPVIRIETQLDGTQKEVVIPAEQYTHVRWLAKDALPSKGGKHRFTYRVSVK